MTEKRPALGRGLSALIPESPRPQPVIADRESERPTQIDLDLLVPNPRQPRTYIDEARLEELAQSIRTNGVIQPLLVRRVEGRFEIVAGERRWRAAQRAGLLKVPIVLREVDDDHLLQIALIENIQRDDLNPIEEAQAYRRLIDEHQLSQEALSAAVGKDRATIANYLGRDLDGTRARSRLAARRSCAAPRGARSRRARPLGARNRSDRAARRTP